MNFTLEQMLTMIGLGLVVLGGIFAFYRLLYAQINDLAKEMAEKFHEADVDRMADRKEASGHYEQRRAEMMTGLAVLSDRIDTVQTQYARREDIVLLTASLTNLTARLDGFLTLVAGRASGSL